MSDTKDNNAATNAADAETTIDETLVDFGDPADAGTDTVPDDEAAAPVDDAKAELVRLREENAALKDQVLRAMADAENTRRRAEREKEDTAKFAISKFAKDLLEVADNLGRALDAAPEGATVDETMVANLRAGIEATSGQLIGVFGRHGLNEVRPEIGTKFDPNLHQAMFEVPGTPHPAGMVVQVVQSGYQLSGRLIRPAMVGVSKGDPVRVDTEA